MININEILLFKDVEIILSLLKSFFVNCFVFYMALKLINQNLKIEKKNIALLVVLLIITILYEIIKNVVNSGISIICVDICLSLTFAIFSKNNLGQSLLTISISLSINYILLILSLIISFEINEFIHFHCQYINLVIILMIYAINTYLFLRIKRIKNGFLFLKQRLDNEYFDILILNISIIILFSYIILTGTDSSINKGLFLGFIVFSIMMFITIRKSLQLCYKQKLLIQNFEEIKVELLEKNSEIRELEKEIFEFNKMKHSILHKQKSLEYRIMKLIEYSEISSEIGIDEEIKSLREEIYQRNIQIELKKTGIEEIDSMLRYLQSECIKNKIEFELQINGNIQQMVNSFISKEKLEILIADHVKNAIIAIQHSNNEYRNILVRIGNIDEEFSLYIYDTGIEFAKNTLERLGKEPVTTHKDEEGTGMGFMNTFETLEQYNATLIIKEIGKPSNDNYTKVLIIKFDKKHEFKILSYR